MRTWLCLDFQSETDTIMLRKQRAWQFILLKGSKRTSQFAINPIIKQSCELGFIVVRIERKCRHLSLINNILLQYVCVTIGSQRYFIILTGPELGPRNLSKLVSPILIPKTSPLAFNLDWGQVLVTRLNFTNRVVFLRKIDLPLCVQVLQLRVWSEPLCLVIVYLGTQSTPRPAWNQQGKV